MSLKRPRTPRGVEESVPAPEIPVTAWTGCYTSGWPKELCTPETWAHPAKFSYNLIERIYNHARTEGWMPPGTICLDPFMGVGLGAVHCLRLGCAYVGVELEPRFFLTAQANLAKWMHEYRHLPGWGPWAMCVNGDSRRLLEHVPAPAGCAVGSPPYAQSVHDHGGIDASKLTGNPAGRHSQALAQGYGHTAGQMGAMPVGLAVSSPPYADGCAHTGGSDPKPEHVQGGTVHHVAYGMTEGQLAGMTVSSPPYQGGGHHPDQTGAWGGFAGERQHHTKDMAGYGETRGQLGQMQGDTFWSAAHAVVAQTVALLRPGGHAIWIVKSYVRHKKLVDFPGDWRRMCESVGFVTLHEHHAMLVEDHGTQGMLFVSVEALATALQNGTAEPTQHGAFIGETVRTAKKSFFRRIAEKKGSPKIDFETIYCMVKPRGEGPGVDCCVASPPYSVGLGKEHTYADHAKRDKSSHRRIMTEKGIVDPFYGETPGNLGNMPGGEAHA